MEHAADDRLDVEARVDLQGVIQHTYVDYRWELDSGVSTRLMLQPRVALVATGAWRVLGVDGTRHGALSIGFRGEGGVRFAGRSATLELFLAAEQRDGSLSARILDRAMDDRRDSAFQSLGPFRVP